ncbi:conserved Plasmodium protein, unknown function [Plasmodium sp. gorilla clade G2]|uniref:conserved Plasmodium protein, unknown function n=1 Tax=Plasmodium sp. gorilla clade G2 TaxID=880535 RepID=UPI000D21F94E|nr:conserved Plasmodium protein, unknown function [Plasmodium sp. gorilla clade G2]SOV15508.1 conserved Plasmodium protein, unknown function [Plasmodium sp. gorilla clade G2]
MATFRRNNQKYHDEEELNCDENKSKDKLFHEINKLLYSSSSEKMTRKPKPKIVVSNGGSIRQSDKIKNEKKDNNNNNNNNSISSSDDVYDKYISSNNISDKNKSSNNICDKNICNNNIYDKDIHEYNMLYDNLYTYNSTSNKSDYSQNKSDIFQLEQILLESNYDSSLKNNSINSCSLSLTSFSSRNTSSILDEYDNIIKIFIENITLDNITYNEHTYNNIFCISYFIYEDPLEIFSFFQGINWLPELKNRCTSICYLEKLDKKSMEKNNYYQPESYSYYININQYVNLKNRKNEHLYIYDDGIIYIFVSIVGVNMSEFEKYYYDNFIQCDNNIYYDHDKKENEHSLHFNNNITNDNLSDKSHDIYSNEQKKKKKRFIHKKNYKNFLNILGTCIIPIKVNDTTYEHTNKINNSTMYNIYQHDVIRSILNNYYDSLKIKRKINIYDLINNHKHILSPIGKINISIKIKNKLYYMSNMDTCNYLMDIQHDEKEKKNLLDRTNHMNKIIDEILNYVKIYKANNKKNNKQDDTHIKHIKDKILSKFILFYNEKGNINFDDYLMKSFSYIESNIDKIFNCDDEKKVLKKIKKRILNILQLYKRKEPKRNKQKNKDNSDNNDNCYNYHRVDVSKEIICTHIILFVDYISNIKIPWKLLSHFKNDNTFFVVVYWKEEDDEEEDNMTNIISRQSRVIHLNNNNNNNNNSYYYNHCNSIEVDYNSCVLEKYQTNNIITEQYNYNINNLKDEEKNKMIKVKLNFNSCIILPYNHYNISSDINLILYHNNYPFLEFKKPLCILNNYNITYNAQDKFIMNLKINQNYYHSNNKININKLNIDDTFVQLSLCKHPKHSTFFSSINYKSYYKNKTKCSIQDTNYYNAHYSPPLFNKNGHVFIFCDDYYINHEKYNENKKYSFLYPKDDIKRNVIFNKETFFIPICQGNTYNEKKDKVTNTYLKQKQKIDTYMIKDKHIEKQEEDQEKKKKNSLSCILKTNILYSVVAKGDGLKGGKLNEWISLYVHTINKEGDNIYYGKHINIRMKIEPIGYLKSYYSFSYSNISKEIKDNNNNIMLTQFNESNVIKNEYNNISLISSPMCFHSFNNIQEMINYKVEDLQNGIYKILYKVNKIGKKKLYIYCDGISVSSSPFEINISPSSPCCKLSKVVGKGVTRCISIPYLYDIKKESFFINHVGNTDAKINGKNDDLYNMKEMNNVDYMKEINNMDDVKEMNNVDDMKEMHNMDDMKEMHKIDDVKEMHKIDDVKEMHKIDDVKEMHSVNDKEESNNMVDKKDSSNNGDNSHIISIQKNDDCLKINNTNNNNNNNNNNDNNNVDICFDKNPVCITSESNKKNANMKYIYGEENNQIFKSPKYYDEINGNIIKLNEKNEKTFEEFLKNMVQVVNTFDIILYDKNGERICIGNDNIKVIGNKGAYIKNVIDNNNGTYTVQYCCCVKKDDIKKIRNINKEKLIGFYDEFLFHKNKYYDNVIINEFKKRFFNVFINCEIKVYINEEEIYGSPFFPIIINMHEILNIYNLYDQYTYSGMLLKNFEYLLTFNNYQGCIQNLYEFYETFVDTQDDLIDNKSGQKKKESIRSLLQMKNDEKINMDRKNYTNLFFNIPLNIYEMNSKYMMYDVDRYMENYENEEERKKKTPIFCNNNNNIMMMNSSCNNYKINDKLSIHNDNYTYNICKDDSYDSFSINNYNVKNENLSLNEWLYLYSCKEHVTQSNKKYDNSIILAYSLCNIILHHLIYLKKYKYYINCKQYENDLLQNNILIQFKKLLQEEYNKMFAYQTNNIITYCKKIGNIKFNNLEELIKVYKNIAFELRKLKKNDLADEFDKCCENMCEELYLKNIESNLNRKEKLLNEYEEIINEKINKIEHIKNNELKKYENNYTIDMNQIHKLCSVPKNKEVQTCDDLSYQKKNEKLSSLIELRNKEKVKNINDEKDDKHKTDDTIKEDDPKSDQIQKEQIFHMVREYWKNSSTYDIFSTIKNTLKNCPRLKICLEETFNYYSCSIKTNNKMKDIQMRKIHEIKIVENLDNLKKIELQEENFLSNHDINNSYLTYNAYISLILDMKCNSYLIKDVDNVLWLFEKFSIEHNSFKNIYRPYGLLRIMPKYLFIPFMRELAYLNLLYIISEYVIKNQQDIKTYLTINHPSRLSSFHHFITYHFIPFYEQLSENQNFDNFKQQLIEINEDDDKTELEDHHKQLNDKQINMKNKNNINKHINDIIPLNNIYNTKNNNNNNSNNQLSLSDIENYFNNELPLIVKHKNFSKTFPLLFDFYSNISMNINKKKIKSGTSQDEKTNTTLTDNQYDNSNNSNKYITTTIFIKFLREFGIIPHFFNNDMCLSFLNTLTKNNKHNKLYYEDFSKAIILSICECVKKNILTQYNMLTSNNQFKNKLQIGKILNHNYISYEVKELIYLFGFSDLHIVKSKINIQKE